jgi:hypothetical protein
MRVHRSGLAGAFERWDVGDGAQVASGRDDSVVRGPWWRNPRTVSGTW